MWEEILEKVKAFLLHDQNNRMKIKKKVVVEIKNEMLSPTNFVLSLAERNYRSNVQGRENSIHHHSRLA